MRELACTVHVTVGALPFELLLWREHILVIVAIADVSQRSIAFEAKFKRLEVIDALADPESHVEMRSDDHEFYEDGLLVKFVEILEVGDEIAATICLDIGKREFVKAVILRIVIVDREHILDLGRRFQPQLDVVTKKESVRANRNDITRRAIVFGRYTLGRNQLRVDGTEDLLAIRVELTKSLAQLSTVLVETRTDDLVGTTLQRLRGWRRRCRCLGDHFWGFFRHLVFRFISVGVSAPQQLVPRVFHSTKRRRVPIAHP